MKYETNVQTNEKISAEVGIAGDLLGQQGHGQLAENLAKMPQSADAMDRVLTAWVGKR